MTGTLHRVGQGGNRRWVYEGITAFSGAGTTVEIPIPDDIGTITAFTLSPIGAAAAANGQLSIDEATAVDGDGKTIIPVLANSVTANRIAGTDSGLKFSYVIWGRGG